MGGGCLSLSNLTLLQQACLLHVPASLSVLGPSYLLCPHPRRYSQSRSATPRKCRMASRRFGELHPTCESTCTHIYSTYIMVSSKKKLPIPPTPHPNVLSQWKDTYSCLKVIAWASPTTAVHTSYGMHSNSFRLPDQITVAAPAGVPCSRFLPS